jgi:hypothetical protein
MIHLRRLFFVTFLGLFAYGAPAQNSAAQTAASQALTHDTMRVVAVYADGHEATILTFYGGGYGSGRTWTVPPRAAALEAVRFEPSATALRFAAPEDSAALAEVTERLVEVMAIPYEGFEEMALEMAEEAESDGGMAMMMGAMVTIPDSFPRDARQRARVPLRLAQSYALEAPPTMAQPVGGEPPVLYYAELAKTYAQDPACPVEALLPVWFFEDKSGVSILSEHLELADCTTPASLRPTPLVPLLAFEYDGAWWALAVREAQTTALPSGTPAAFELVRIASGSAHTVGTAYTNAR